MNVMQVAKYFRAIWVNQHLSLYLVEKSGSHKKCLSNIAALNNSTPNTVYKQTMYAAVDLFLACFFSHKIVSTKNFMEENKQEHTNNVFTVSQSSV
jgi:hypothetical protein